MPVHLDCGCCVVRSWRPGDEASLARHANDRGVWLNLRDRFPHPYTRLDAEHWVRFASSRTPETDFAIDVGGQAVGGIGVELHGDIERCSAEIGSRRSLSPATLSRRVNRGVCAPRHRRQVRRQAAATG